MTTLAYDNLSNPARRIKALEKTRRHIDDQIFALEAELGRQEGYIGTEATKTFFAEIRAKAR